MKTHCIRCNKALDRGRSLTCVGCKDVTRDKSATPEEIKNGQLTTSILQSIEKLYPNLYILGWNYNTVEDLIFNILNEEAT